MTAQLIACIIYAIGSLESGNNPHVHDNGKSAGMYQIKPCFVQQVNRDHGTHYTLQDRRNPVKAREMIGLWLSQFTDKDSVEEVALRYTAGQSGWLRATAEQREYAECARNIVEAKLKQQYKTKE